ncbi:MAG: rhomboid family intramembrane serine protease [Akkermansiaceae bacterium]
MSPELRQRLPILLLVMAISIVSVVDWVSALPVLEAVPLNLTLAWKSFLAGNGSGETAATLLTSMSVVLLHGNGSHLIWNMMFFWIFGVAVLEIIGWRWTMVVFLLTAIGATVGHVLTDPYSAISMIGASGAVMGFEGAYLGLAVQKPRPSSSIWPIASPVSPAQLGALGVFGIAMDVMGITSPDPSNIAYGAHIGGFMTGMVLVFFRRA